MKRKLPAWLDRLADSEKWLGRSFLAPAVVYIFALIGLQSACGSSSSTPTTVTGTPAGTYNLTLTATSGTASRTFPVTLIVQ